MKQFLKNYWSDLVFALVCIAIVALAMPYVKDHAAHHAEIRTLDGWSKAQVIVAPNLPCENCGNTIFQLHHVDSKNTVTSVCCLCGVSIVEIDCHGNDAILGLAEIFKQDTAKFKCYSFLDDGGYRQGHIYYRHREKKQ